MVRARHTIWTGQDCPTGNSTRRETKRQTEETMGKKTTLKSGLALNGTAYCGKLRTTRKVVVKSAVVPQRSARLVKANEGIGCIMPSVSQGWL